MINIENINKLNNIIETRGKTELKNMISDMRNLDTNIKCDVLCDDTILSENITIKEVIENEKWVSYYFDMIEIDEDNNDLLNLYLSSYMIDIDYDDLITIIEKGKRFISNNSYELYILETEKVSNLNNILKDIDNMRCLYKRLSYYNENNIDTIYELYDNNIKLYQENNKFIMIPAVIIQPFISNIINPLVVTLRNNELEKWASINGVSTYIDSIDNGMHDFINKLIF